MSALLDELGFMQHLTDVEGYRDPKPIGAGNYACIRPLAYTHAIISGKIGDYYGFDRRWCYHSYDAAKAALDAWDGTGEPTGWHRDPVTGRRLAEGLGPHIDDDGNDVPIGEIYVRQ